MNTDKPKSAKRSKIWVIGIVAVILLASAVIFAVILNRRAAAPATAPVANLELDTSKLPNGWVLGANDDQNAVIEQAVTGCFVAVNKIADKAVRAADALEYIQVQRERLKADMEAKGYKVASVEGGSVGVKTAQGTQSIRSIEFTVTGPEALSQSYAYLVRDGYVWQVQRSCPAAKDLPTSLQGLEAVTIHV